MNRKNINDFLSPFGIKAVDRAVIALFFICVVNAWYCANMLAITPIPISAASRIVRYLLEVDSTICFGQNTEKNRKLKYEKYNRNPSVVSFNDQ